MNCMSAETATKNIHVESRECGELNASSIAPSQATAPQKTKLEKTQSLLTVASTSIGLLGVAGSIFTFALSTFYTGTVEVAPDKNIAGVVVKVYTKEGHESVFHAKQINLMPGEYHLEISSPAGKVVHSEAKIEFNKTTKIPVSFDDPAPAGSAPPKARKRWWQFWKRSDTGAAQTEEAIEQE